MENDELIVLMRTRSGWTTEQLASTADMNQEVMLRQLEALHAEGLVHRSARGNWRAPDAVKATRSDGGESTGHCTRMLVYSPQILAACPEFARNTWLHFVEDEDAHFRLRDYRDGKRIEVKSVNGITLSRELEAAYPRHELEFDDEEALTPLTDNAFGERRIAALNDRTRTLLEQNPLPE